MKGAAIVVLAAALVAAAPLAAHPGAAPKRKAPRFAATVQGTLRTVWLEETRLVEDECTIDLRVSGSKRIDFRSRRPTVVQLTRAGLRATTLRSVAGEIAGTTGTRTSSREPCGKSRQSDDAPVTGGFRDAALALSTPRRGVLQLSRLRLGVADSATWAPPAFGRAAQPLLERAPGRVEVRKLRNSRLRTIIVAGRYTNVVRLAGDLTGNLLQEVDWTLTLRRLP